MIEILKDTAHRPSPIPKSPWIMSQVWHDLLFAHWPVPVETLRPLIPEQLDIDLYGGQAWLGVVPFRMSGVRMRGALGLTSFPPFPELNVRTYVVRDGKPGVWFFSLDAPNALAVWGARQIFHLPYFFAEMRCDEGDGWIEYQSERVAHRAATLPHSSSVAAASFEVRYRPTDRCPSPSPVASSIFSQSVIASTPPIRRSESFAVKFIIQRGRCK